jgi:hypothetical protein
MIIAHPKVIYNLRYMKIATIIITISTAIIARLNTNKLESIKVSTMLATTDITQFLKLPTNKNKSADITIAAKTKPKGLKSPLNSSDFFLFESLLFLLVILAIYFELIILSK